MSLPISVWTGDPLVNVLRELEKKGWPRLQLRRGFFIEGEAQWRAYLAAANRRRASAVLNRLWVRDAVRAAY
jgi:hypothetical protein